jgi:ribonuclease P protein component
MRTSAPRLSRLTKRAEFQAAAGDGRRFRSSCLTVQVLDREEDGAGIRVGLTASRKTGKATKRNRIRRRLRAAAREAYAGATMAADVVVVARAEAIDAPYADLVRSLAEALHKARKAKRHPPGPALKSNTKMSGTERS